MRSAIQEIHNIIRDLTKESLASNDWATPPKRELGDVAIPCFKLAKVLGKAPHAVAGELAIQISEQIGARGGSLLIREVKAAGPYLNVFINSKKFFEESIEQLRTDAASFGASKIGAGKSLVIDFSSPNMAKEIALHHLRSTAIGNALAKIAAFHGYKVSKINYLGDWGTAHGKNILALKLFGNEDDLKAKGVAYMLDLYVRFNQAEKADPALSEQAKAAFAKLEAGDPEYRRIWALFREISIRDFSKTYQRLGIDFDFFDGESLYEKVLDSTIDEVTKKIGTEISDGALVCTLPGHNIPILLKKDDGASLYITRDLAAIQDRANRFHFDLAWYVVAVQQKLHFKQLFDLVAALGKDFAGRAEHISFGMLSFGSKTMKSREGNVIFLNDVLNEARDRALEIIRSKNPNLQNAEAVAEEIGTGAVLFFDLSQNRNHDISFDWERALAFDGDTAPFVQYAHARCTSLYRKGQEHLATLDPSASGATDDIFDHPAVRELLGEWAYFTLYGERALNERDPSQVATSLLSIAKAMNRFYHAIRFLDEKSPARLKVLLELTQGTQKILGHGLALLGIRAPREM